MRNSSKFVLSAAVATTVASLFPTLTRADTITWTGAVADTGPFTATAQGTAAGFTTGQSLYNWNASALNWTGDGTYSVGDDVIFTDNFSGGTDIRLTSSNLNPASITFSHITGSTPVLYRFTHNGGGQADFQDSTPANLSANTPFGAGSSTVLTLDTGFLGRVVMRQRSNSGAAGGNTIIRSGILEISDALALPHNANQNQPPVTLDGGELRINVNTATNTNPASTNLTGTLTVGANGGTLSNGAINNSRIWNGPVVMSNGTTLTLKSIQGFRLDLSNMNLTNTAGGTIRLEDVGANTTVAALQSNNNRGANLIWDLGTGVSELLATTATNTYNLGTLTGGANTKLSGSTTASSTTTYLIGERNENSTYAGTIRNNATQATGLAAVTKTGTGTLTLTGANTYTGATTVSNGTLVVSGALGSISSSAPTINQAATLSIDNTTNNNNRLGDAIAVTLNQGNLVFQGNLTSPTAEVAGALTLAGGSNVVQTTATGAGGPANITFASLARTGGVVDFRPDANVNVGLASSTLTNDILGGHATVNQNDWATVSGGNVAAYSAYTTDTAPGTWGATQNINLTTGGTSTVAASTTINSLRTGGTGTTVSIDAGQTLNIGTGGILATGTGGATISGAGTLTAGSAAAEMIVTVPSAANTLTLSAPVADNGGGAVTLVKAGAGKLVLSGTGSTFTGGTQLLAGTLQVGVANYFPVGSNLTINYGTSFDIGGFNQSFGSVFLIDGSLLNSGAAATVSATTYDVRNGTVSAPLGGAGVLNKTTAGTVTLTGANTYTGGTNVTGGTLAAGATNTLPAAQPVTVSGGATLNVGAFNQSIGTLTVGATTVSSGNVTGTTGVITPSSVDAQNGTISAIIGGSTGVTKAGINTTVTLNGLNTYTGPTVVTNSGNSGTLAVNTLANGGSASSIGAAGTAGTNLVLGGVTLSYTGTGSSTNRLFNLSGNASIGSNGTGPVSFTNTGAIGGGAGGILTLTGSNTGANTMAPLLASPDVAAVTKAGNGTWIVTNNNTYTGATTVSAGVLSVAALANGGVASPIGASSNAGANLVLNGGTLRYTGTGHSTDRMFNLNNNSTLDASGTGAVNFNNTGAISVSGAPRTLTLSGTNTGDNTLAASFGGTNVLVKNGTGRWVLTGTNNYTGGTTVNAGTLAVRRLHEGNAVTIAAGAKMQVLDSSPTLPNHPSGDNAFVSRPSTLTIASTGQLDLGNNDLIIDYTGATSPLAQIHGQIATGFNGGEWNGPGIISTTALNDPNFVLAVAENALLLQPFGDGVGDDPLFSGQVVDDTTVLVKFTHRVDLDLDGLITGNDAAVFNAFFNEGQPATWQFGDLDYDGVYSGNDAAIFNGFYNESLASVPEPAGLALAACGLAMLARRNRRRGPSSN